MQSNFTYVRVTPGSQAFYDVEKINEEAFPPNERRSVEELLSWGKLTSGNKVIAVYEEGECVAFYHLVEMETYTYGAFFAVSAQKRGQGYGSKILQAMLEECKEKPFVGEVEYPSEDAENYEQRIKRIRFYERNGVYVTGKTIDVKGEGKYYIICPDKNFNLDEYYKHFEEFHGQA